MNTPGTVFLGMGFSCSLSSWFQNAFSAAARPHDDEDLAAGDLEVHAMQDLHAIVALLQADKGSVLRDEKRLNKAIVKLSRES